MAAEAKEGGGVKLQHIKSSSGPATASRRPGSGRETSAGGSEAPPEELHEREIPSYLRPTISSCRNSSSTTSSQLAIPPATGRTNQIARKSPSSQLKERISSSKPSSSSSSSSPLPIKQSSLISSNSKLAAAAAAAKGTTTTTPNKVAPILSKSQSFSRVTMTTTKSRIREEKAGLGALAGTTRPTPALLLKSKSFSRVGSGGPATATKKRSEAKQEETVAAAAAKLVVGSTMISSPKRKLQLQLQELVKGIQGQGEKTTSCKDNAAAAAASSRPWAPAGAKDYYLSSGSSDVVEGGACRVLKFRQQQQPQPYNEVIEETASKLQAERRNKVLALVGAFETVISSLQEPIAELQEGQVITPPKAAGETTKLDYHIVLNGRSERENNSTKVLEEETKVDVYIEEDDINEARTTEKEEANGNGDQQEEEKEKVSQLDQEKKEEEEEEEERGAQEEHVDNVMGQGSQQEEEDGVVLGQQQQQQEEEDSNRTVELIKSAESTEEESKATELTGSTEEDENNAAEEIKFAGDGKH